MIFHLQLSITLIILIVSDTRANQLHTGSNFQIECPVQSSYSISNSQNHAIVLQNGQRSTQIVISYIDQLDILRTCILNKNNKLCIFETSIVKFNIQCGTFGSANLVVYTLNRISNLQQNDIPFTKNALMLSLETEQKGVVRVRPQNFSPISINIQDLFISNCIQQIVPFQDQILVGVKAKQTKCGIIIQQFIQVQCFFYASKLQYQNNDVIQTYLLTNESETYTADQNQQISRVNILLKLQYLHNLPNISLLLTTYTPQSSNQLSSKQLNISLEHINRQIPPKISIIAQTYIKSLSIKSNQSIYYEIQFLSSSQIEEISQNTIIYYFYEKMSFKSIILSFHMPLFFNTMYSKPYSVITDRIYQIDLIIDNQIIIENGLQTKDLFYRNSSFQLQALSNSQNSQDFKIIFEIQPYKSQTSNQQARYFSLLLKQKIDERSLKLGVNYNLHIREYVMQKFIVSKSEMTNVTKKNLKVFSEEDLNIMATYNKTCNSRSCCQYPYANRIEVKRDYDLILLVKAHPSTIFQNNLIEVSLQIDENDQQFKLIDGIIHQQTLKYEQTFIFQRKNYQEVKIVCYTEQNPIFIFVNTNNTFPSRQNFVYQSNQGFISIPSHSSTIYILVQRTLKITPLNPIMLSIVALGSKGQLQLRKNKPLKILPKIKVKQYIINHGCNPLQKVYFKIHSKSAQTKNTTLIFHNQILNQTVYFNEYYITQITKFFMIPDIPSQIPIIQSQQDHMCQMKIILNQTVHNFVGTMMYFTQKQIYQIKKGQFSVDNFLTDQPLQLYCLIDPKLSTNIYAYSNTQQIKMATKIVTLIPNKFSKNYNDIFMKLNAHPLPRNSDKFSFRQIAYHDANMSNSQGSVFVLITISKQRSNPDSFTKFKIYTICTQDATQLHNDLKVYYRLHYKQKHNFICRLGQQYYKKPEKRSNKKLDRINTKSLIRQILLQTSFIRGYYLIAASLYNKTNKLGQLDLNRKPSYFDVQFQAGNSTSIVPSRSPIVIIKSSDSIQQILMKLNTKNKQSQQYLKETELSIRFQIVCQSSADGCSFLTSFQNSATNIHQMTPGTPSMFRLSKHSTTIFLYNNLVEDKFFKFKINRKKGFPKYQICSSKPDNPNDFCLKKLQQKAQSQQNFIDDNAFESNDNQVIGRTHQLIIHQYSPIYCTKCQYYLALYSQYQIVEGSIFVMFSNMSTILQQGNSVTTIVYRNQSDQYMIVDSSLYVLIYLLDKPLKIQIKINGNTTYAPLQDLLDIVDCPQIAGMKMKQKQGQQTYFNYPNLISIRLKDDISSQQPFHLKIEAANNLPSALYTLIIVNKKQQNIVMKDGIPYEMNSSISLMKTVNYFYRSEGDGIIMITSKNLQDLDINIQCEDQGIEHSQLKMHQSSQLSNRIDINFSNQTCRNFRLRISVKKMDIVYKVMVSSIQIITLPLNTQLPGLLQTQGKLYQIYEVAVSQSTPIRCILKFCQGGSGLVTVSDSKNNINQQTLGQTTLQITEQSPYVTLNFISKPGVFYIKVQFKGRGGYLEYVIFVEDTNKMRDGGKYFEVAKNTKRIEYKLIRLEQQFTEFNLKFYPIVLDLNKYQINYYVIESNRQQLLDKSQKCGGKYFINTVNNHQQVLETKLQFTRNYLQQAINNQSPIQHPYRTTNPYNYIAIIPLVYDKQLQQFYHRSLPKYKKTKLSNGQFFKKISFILQEFTLFVQRYLDIHNSENYIMIVIVSLIGFCMICGVAGGIWLGSKFCFKTKYVYVLKQLDNQQTEQTRMIDQIVAQEEDSRQLTNQSLNQNQ